MDLDDSFFEFARALINRMSDKISDTYDEMMSIANDQNICIGTKYKKLHVIQQRQVRLERVRRSLSRKYDRVVEIALAEFDKQWE